MSGYLEQAARVTDGVTHHGTDFAVGMSLVVLGGGIVLVGIATGGITFVAAASVAGSAGLAHTVGGFIDGRRAREITERIERGAATVFMDEPRHPAAMACLDTTVDVHHPAWVCRGSSSVFIEGWNASRIGDTTTCDGLIVEGSSTIFTGGEQVLAPDAPENPNEIRGGDLFRAYSFSLMVAGMLNPPRNAYEAVVYGAARLSDLGVLREQLAPVLTAEGVLSHAAKAPGWWSALSRSPLLR
jgi:uncharacterized Zn-binding protein involved in type VI secretion